MQEIDVKDIAFIYDIASKFRDEQTLLFWFLANHDRLSKSAVQVCFCVSIQGFVEVILDSQLWWRSEEAISRPFNQRCLDRALEVIATDIYSKDDRAILELLRNAEANTYAESVCPMLECIISEDSITAICNEVGMTCYTRHEYMWSTRDFD